jgi:hypothetical protein
VAVHDDAGRVDENEAADATRADERELGGDPAADGVPDDGNVVEIELIEERGVERGETLDALQRIGARRAVEPGVSRGEDTGAVSGAEQLTEAGDGDGARAAVQQEERFPSSLLADGDAYLAES